MIMSEPARDEPRRVNMQARVASPVRTGSLLELAPLLELAVCEIVLEPQRARFRTARCQYYPLPAAPPSRSPHLNL